MAVEIVLDMFSGRPNPTWVLDSKQESELIQRLSALPSAGSFETVEPPALGYRGLLLQITHGQQKHSEPIRVYGGTVRQVGKILEDDARALEKWLLQTGASTIQGELIDQALNSIPPS
jgi:hypothetical protein